MLKPSYILSLLLRQENVGDGFPFASHFSVIKLPFCRLLEWTILGASKRDTSHLTKKTITLFRSLINTQILKQKKWEPTFNTWRDNYSSRYKYTPGGTPGNLGGVCPPFLQILILFRSKNVIFHIRFQTWPLKSRPTWAEIHFRLYKLLFLSFLFIWNWNDKCAQTLDPVVPSDHTRLQTKTDKIYNCFQTEMAQKPYPSGQHWVTYMIY